MNFKQQFQENLAALSKELSRSLLFLDFRKDYLVVKLHTLQFSKKSVAISLKRQIQQATKIIQRYQCFDLSSEQLALYDGLPGPNDPDYLSKIQQERYRLLDETKSNAWKALFVTLLKNGPIVLALSILFGLLRVYYKISILPFETLILLSVFNLNLEKRFNKIDLKAQLINGFSAITIFLSHIYINMLTTSLVKKGTMVHVTEFFSILNENISNLNKGIFTSFVFIGLIIFKLSKTKREIVTSVP